MTPETFSYQRCCKIRDVRALSNLFITFRHFDYKSLDASLSTRESFSSKDWTGMKAVLDRRSISKCHPLVHALLQAFASTKCVRDATEALQLQRKIKFSSIIWYSYFKKLNVSIFSTKKESVHFIKTVSYDTGKICKLERLESMRFGRFENFIYNYQALSFISLEASLITKNHLQ